MGEEEEGDAETNGEGASLMAELKVHFKRFGDRAPLLAKQALEQTARDIVDITRQFVPVDTGDLRNSYTYEFKDDDTIIVGSNKLMGPRVRKNETYYAPWVEFGLDGQPDQPHFTPAFQQARKIFTARFKQLMEKER